MDYYMMRRRHGKGPQGRKCGECVFAKAPKDGPDYEGELHCKPDGARRPHLVEELWPACGRFESPWRRERQALEQLGQRRIEFQISGF
jgi:hypothetical protein